MGTLVSPILGAAVAMPAASRCSERIASRVEEERIGIVEKTDEQLCATTSKYEEKRELGNSRSDSCQFMLVIHRRLTANHIYRFVRLFPLRPNQLPLLLLFAVIHLPTSRSSADYRDLPQMCSPDQPWTIRCHRFQTIYHTSPTNRR